MPVSLKNKRVLVVGASSGIGRSCAILFAREGCRVAACARRRERLEQLKAEVSSEGGAIEIYTADVSKVDDMERVANESGEVDVLLYASGTNTPDRTMSRLTPEVWNDLITTNLNGAYYATRAVLPRMREKGEGHLIYIASISGLVPDLSGAAYQASKRGIVGLAHAIRVEEKENGIRTCAICPGLVETEILEKRPVKPSPEQLAKALQPEDVAEVALAIAKLPARAAVPEIQLMPASIQ